MAKYKVTRGIMLDGTVAYAGSVVDIPDGHVGLKKWRDSKCIEKTGARDKTHREPPLTHKADSNKKPTPSNSTLNPSKG